MLTTCSRSPTGGPLHAQLSARSQPFAYYDYPIFVAEVASTFNEQLLSKYMLDRAKSKQERALLLNRQIDAIRSTIFRQTMFAEFEKLAHASAEAGEPLTLERFKEIYHGLLKLYFAGHGSGSRADLECLRVPHFYRAFYVYKYAANMSAAMALVDRVTRDNQPGSTITSISQRRLPRTLDTWRAGVDVERPDRVIWPGTIRASGPGWSRSSSMVIRHSGIVRRGTVQWVSLPACPPCVLSTSPRRLRH